MKSYPGVPGAVAVKLDEVQSEDFTYAFSCPRTLSVPELLLRSVAEQGIVVPVRLEQIGDRLRVISGFRRITAATETGLEQVPALIEKVDNPLETFISVIWENVTCREPTPLEKGYVLYKLKHSFGVSEDDLIDRFLPILGNRPTRYYLDLYLRLRELPAIVEGAVAEGLLSPDLASKVSGWKTSEQESFLETVVRYQLGVNKQRQFLELLADLRSILRSDIGEICNQAVSNLKGSGEGQLEPSFSQLRQSLWCLRYPVMAKHMGRLETLRKRLDLPDNIRLQVPESLEGEKLSFVVDVMSSSELRQALYALQQRSELPEIEEIFELL